MQSLLILSLLSLSLISCSALSKGNYQNQVGSGKGVGTGGPNKGHHCRREAGEICFRFAFCKFYQVTPAFNDYGCSKCQSGYELSEDANGAGICLANTSNTIANCEWAALDINSNHVCYQCSKGYYLNSTTGLCTLLPILFVKNDLCKAYFTTVAVPSNTDIRCQACISDYTLNTTTNTCNIGCILDDCDSCYTSGIAGTAVRCFECRKNKIGVYDPTISDNYAKCIDCKEWQIDLLTPAAQDLVGSGNNGQSQNTK
jgi:hypothetical protein